MATRVGIPTKYKGVQFRSRLEARWAVMFDLLEWDWEYEPLDAKGYIPDFVLTGDKPVLVEVKPDLLYSELDEYWPRISRALFGIWAHDYIIIGGSPTPTIDGYGAPEFQNKNPSWADPYLGVLGEWDGDTEVIQAHIAEDWVKDAAWKVDGAVWSGCQQCHKAAFFHEWSSYACRPCGHHDGDHYLSPMNAAWIKDRWIEAGNQVQWHPKVRATDSQT